VLIVDDGFATGATARAAALVARARGADTVVLAAPIGAADTIAGLREVADEVVCLGAPRDFMAVGQGYDEFGQTSDEEVCALLAAARRRPAQETGQ
jgi:predicted phosphoribosyltransferase